MNIVNRSVYHPEWLPVLLLLVFGFSCPAHAETGSHLVVHEFTINGRSDNFTITLEEEILVRGVVENTGEEPGTIHLKLDGRPHYVRWEIEPGETKEIESELYSHRRWYEGEFLMSLGGKEIKVEVIKESSETEAQHSPWPYVELDVEKVRLLAHRSYYEHSCSYGAFHGIVASLRKEIGEPYTEIPTYMLHFGRGGFMGEQSVCGAMVGAMAAINLIAAEEYRPLGEKLVAYYKEEELPTAIWDQYLDRENGPIDPEEHLAEPVKGSISPSIDCKDSVRSWSETSGTEAGAARSERCARLTGDIAAKAAELLNEWHRNRNTNSANETPAP